MNDFRPVWLKPNCEMKPRIPTLLLIMLVSLCVLVVTGSWWLNNCIIAWPGDTAESCNNDQILQYKYHVNTNKYTPLPPATCGSLQADTDNRVSFVHMQHPLKYLTHLSTFWPIRMTATRHLRQKTCCVSFFEYLMKSVSFTKDKQKTLTFTLLWKISTFWAEKIFHFFLKLSTLDISRHVTYERSYAARAATLPRVPALVITPSVAASRNTAAPRHPRVDTRRSREILQAK